MRQPELPFAPPLPPDFSNAVRTQRAIIAAELYWFGGLRDSNCHAEPAYAVSSRHRATRRIVQQEVLLTPVAEDPQLAIPGFEDYGKILVTTIED